METFSDYTILCTQEQTIKAIELGAPIEGIFIPTAEQMIGWLEEKGLIFNIVKVTGLFNKASWYGFKIISRRGYTEYNVVQHHSRPEATLAAIDAALDYLIENKK